MDCLVETCEYKVKHDADMAEHAIKEHGAFFRRGRDGAEFIYLVDARVKTPQEQMSNAGLDAALCDLENTEVCEACQ